MSAYELSYEPLLMNLFVSAPIGMIELLLLLLKFPN